MAVSVLTADEYQAGEYDAVLVRDRTVLCLRTEAGDAEPGDRGDGDRDELCRVVPLDNVHHVDGDPELFVPGNRIPESFYGGARYGFLDPEAFPEIGPD